MLVGKTSTQAVDMKKDMLVAFRWHKEMRRTQRRQPLTDRENDAVAMRCACSASFNPSLGKAWFRAGPWSDAVTHVRTMTVQAVDADEAVDAVKAVEAVKAVKAVNEYTPCP